MFMSVMSILKSSTCLSFSGLKTTFISLLIGYVVYKLARFYVKVFSLPPGPIPLPFLGNILEFRGTKEHWSRELEKIAQKYGSVFTFWLGNRYVVVINDIDIARNAFNKNAFTGRPKDLFFPESDKFFANDERKDIIFTSSHTWEALRRVTHSAVLKYSVTDKLASLVSDTVDHAIDNMVKNEGINKPFVPLVYVYNMFLNILAASAFGTRYELDDPEFKFIKYAQKEYFNEVTMRVFFWQMSKVFKWMDIKAVNQLRKNMNGLIELMEIKFKSHYNDYDEHVIKDFCDALISAKNEALEEGKEWAPHLKDNNLALALLDVFLAGTDTSQMTFKWCLLHMLYNKQFEKKLRKEVVDEIGDRIATHEDKNRCHYIMAYISEVLRHSNIVPWGVNHKTLVQTKLANYTIEEGTEVMLYQGYIMHQDKHWDKPYELIPERFLDSDGKYLTTRPKAFIPFGVGRRICLGEKLAMNDLFLVLVRFLQRTSDYEIVLHCDPNEDMTMADPNNAFEYQPKHFEISLIK